MFMINNILVSDEILEKKFCCNLAACKGVCCVEGDYGAPLEPEEREILKAIYDKVEPGLDDVSRDAIDANGVEQYFPGMNDYGTTLRPDGACAFVTFDESGMALCGIEKKYNEGIIDFKKPLSCELYPIRVNRDREVGFTALNYDEWEICTPAIMNGEKLGLPLVVFAKEALIRGFGEEFYNALEAAQEFYNEKEKQ